MTTGNLIALTCLIIVVCVYGVAILIRCAVYEAAEKVCDRLDRIADATGNTYDELAVINTRLAKLEMEAE